ncbi:hypothetical protein ACFWVM_30180 [Nocardia fluminea]|uniref:hypothetical protein n=1 Tax=Nocardia fluminea TaxID=134984 RepID=UPI00365C4670
MFTVAAIAAVAALIGAGVGGGATLLAARTQVVAQSETEAAKFLRDERTKFYTQVLEKVEGLQRSELNVYVDKDNIESELLGTLKTSSDYSEAVQELSGLTSRSMLLSSDKTQSVLSDMVNARQDMASKISTLVGAVILADSKYEQALQGVNLHALDKKTATDRFNIAHDKLIAVDVDLVMTMRSELGIPLP